MEMGGQVWSWTGFVGVVALTTCGAQETSLPGHNPRCHPHNGKASHPPPVPRDMLSWGKSLA